MNLVAGTKPGQFHCAICHDPLPVGPFWTCDSHALEPMDERWDDCPDWPGPALPYLSAVAKAKPEAQ